MKNAIETFDLTKVYNNNFKAVKSLNLKIPDKSIFGMLGPNGAGKTTTIKMLTCLIQPTSGSATVGGYDIRKNPNEVRNLLGMVPQQVSLYKDLTIMENSQMCADFYGVPRNERDSRIEDLMELVDIKYAKDKRVSQLSGGQKQKASLVASLVHRPEILFLDEPTTGVDAVSRSEFWSMLADLKQRGITILVSTPYMDEASLCDRIALCNEGRLLGLDSPHQLVASFQSPLWAIRAKNMYALLEVARRFEGVTECYPFGEFHHLVVTDAFDAEKFARQMNRCDDFVMCEAHPTIEDLFIKLMKR